MDADKEMETDRFPANSFIARNSYTIVGGMTALSSH
jgi:hypothetical protein